MYELGQDRSAVADVVQSLLGKAVLAELQWSTDSEAVHRFVGGVARVPRDIRTTPKRLAKIQGRERSGAARCCV